MRECKEYAERHNMTAAQVTEYYRKSDEASTKKYGFKIIASAKEKTT
ncbi:MAG: hypothetical protein FWH04_05760 [Oscillospiraceae bacterium]|nr:hypothetical protein [Oscillospiraceae bacterium]